MKFNNIQYQILYTQITKTRNNSWKRAQLWSEGVLKNFVTLVHSIQKKKISIYCDGVLQWVQRESKSKIILYNICLSTIGIEAIRK